VSARSKMTTATHRSAVAALALFVAGATSGCVRRMSFLHVPPAPQAGHIPDRSISAIRKGLPTAELVRMFGQALDVTAGQGHEVWHYRVQPMMRCTTVTKRLLGRTTSSTHPAEDPHAYITVRDGAVDGVDVTPTPATQAVR